MSASDPVWLTDEAIEAAVKAAGPTIPNTGGVLWDFIHEDGQVEPVTLTHAVRAVLLAAGPHIAAEFEKLLAVERQHTATEQAKVALGRTILSDYNNDDDAYQNDNFGRLWRELHAALADTHDGGNK